MLTRHKYLSGLVPSCRRLIFCDSEKSPAKHCVYYYYYILLKYLKHKSDPSTTDPQPVLSLLCYNQPITASDVQMGESQKLSNELCFFFPTGVTKKLFLSLVHVTISVIGRSMMINDETAPPPSLVVFFSVD